MTTLVTKSLYSFQVDLKGGPFGTIVYNGAVAAAEHTGCEVDYYWSQWNSEIMIKQFKEAVAFSQMELLFMVFQVMKQ